MLIDGSIAIIPLAAPLSLVLGLGVSAQSSILDLAGVGVGVAPPNFIGTRTLFGMDLGVDDQKAQILVNSGIAFTTGTGATLNIQFQGAPDTGAAGGYLPGVWQTLNETGLMAVANLTANTTVARFDFPPALPQKTWPRFLRLSFSIPAATNFLTGTIASAFPTIISDQWSAQFAGRNFSVA